MRGIRTIALAGVIAASLAAPAALSAQATDGGPDAVATYEPVPAGPRPAPEPPPSAAVSEQDADTAPVIRATASGAIAVTVGDYFYKPRNLTVNRGDTVSWTNKGKVKEGHTVTGDGFDSGVFDQGEIYTHTFNKSGSYPYICTLHPNMEGTVKVRGASSESGESGGSGGDSDATAEQNEANQGSETRRSGGGVASESASGDTASSDSTGSLPATGLDPTLLAIIGLVLVELGLLARVAVSPRRYLPRAPR